MSLNYEKLLSAQVQQLRPSGIRKFFDLLENIPDAVALTVGQPDFVTPWHIREAGIESLEAGRTYYTANSGLKALREAAAGYLARRFALEYGPEEIMITVGGSEAIDVALRAVINPGDEVIIPVPCFVCYEPLVRMAGGVPVLVETCEKDAFRLTAESLRQALTPRTKLLVLPYPGNPTGAILDRETLEALAGVLRGTDVLILSDEIYAELTYGKRHVSMASLPGMKERTIVASGFSKAFAMTGWRLGYLAAPLPILRQMLKIHQFAIMCAPTMSQFAAVEALRNGDEDIEEMKAEYNRRRRFLVNGLHSIGLSCFEPEGAFYTFPNIGSFGLSSEVFCNRLLEEEKVAIVPGTAFGSCGEGFARLSYAYSLRHITEALERMERFIRKLRREDA